MLPEMNIGWYIAICVFLSVSASKIPYQSDSSLYAQLLFYPVSLIVFFSLDNMTKYGFNKTNKTYIDLILILKKPD